MTPDETVRLLRAKVAELEYTAKKVSMPDIALTAPLHIARLAADIALIAQLLADHIDKSEERFGKLVEMVTKLTDTVVILKDRT